MATELSITLEELEAEIGIILQALKVQSKRLHLVKDVSVEFVCEDFGTVICGMQRADYGYVSKSVRENFPGYRYVYISNFDNLIEAKEKVIWELMCGGYMKYVRENFRRQFEALLTMQNYSRKIINERLRRWADRPRYKFMIDENKIAQDIPVTMILANEPCFFDYMPEEEI